MGPGMIGTKLPTRPNNTRVKPIKIKKISIRKFEGLLQLSLKIKRFTQY
jgi:hypothetical protein